MSEASTLEAGPEESLHRDEVEMLTIDESGLQGKK